MGNERLGTADCFGRFKSGRYYLEGKRGETQLEDVRKHKKHVKNRKETSEDVRDLRIFIEESKKTVGCE